MSTKFDFNGVFDGGETIKIDGKLALDPGATFGVENGVIVVTGVAHVVTDNEIDVTFVPAPPLAQPPADGSGDATEPISIPASS